MYEQGDYVEREVKKFLHNWEQAVILGNESARHNLGFYEVKRGNITRAIKHLMIAISAGSKGSFDLFDDLVNLKITLKKEYSEIQRGRITQGFNF
jgi:TPR repeat protein